MARSCSESNDMNVAGVTQSRSIDTCNWLDNNNEAWKCRSSMLPFVRTPHVDQGIE